LIEDQIIELQKTEEKNKELKKKKLLLDDVLKFCVNYMTSHIQISNPNSLLETFKRYKLTETAETFGKLFNEKSIFHSYMPLSRTIKQPVSVEERLIEPVINRYPNIFLPASIDKCEQYLDDDCEKNRFCEIFINPVEIEVTNSVQTELEDFIEFRNINTSDDDLDLIDVQDLVQFNQLNLSEVMNF
jgi:hypothetical protein